MGRPIIEIENISKLYRIGAHKEPYLSLRDEVAKFTSRLRRRTKDQEQLETIFWALNDVSFTIQEGETVGIIGRNGAGKSTLLKILSQITPPTRGKITMHGRVASLLEVGTGFHPELTGRENIVLNGTILGMTKREVMRKFEEIVAFAEIEDFLDTPVKRYSSGMYVRLAFAVAAHLEPEILIVDEVLAVGDASFQKKCLNKMQDVGREGRTVIFVSHNMQAISRLCSRAVHLSDGKVIRDGISSSVVSAYLRSDTDTVAAKTWDDFKKAPGNDIVRLTGIRVKKENGLVVSEIEVSQPIGIEIEFKVLKLGHVLVPNLHLFNEDGILVFSAHDTDQVWRRKQRPVGQYISTMWIPENFLSEGCLIVRAAICTHDPFIVHVDERDVVAFHIIDDLKFDSARGDYAGPMPGIVRPYFKWTTDYSH